MEARHLNGDHEDNTLKNLKWGTYSRNIRDVMYHGGRKVSEQDIREIRKRRRAGETFPSIAKAFNISNGYAANICYGRNYPHVK